MIDFKDFMTKIKKKKVFKQRSTKLGRTEFGPGKITKAFIKIFLGSVNKGVCFTAKT